MLFTHAGELLASAGDGELRRGIGSPTCIHAFVHSLDGVVCIWKLSEVAAGGNMVADEGLVNKENWTVTKTLRLVKSCLRVERGGGGGGPQL